MFKIKSFGGFLIRLTKIRYTTIVSEKYVISFLLLVSNVERTIEKNKVKNKNKERTNVFFKSMSRMSHGKNCRNVFPHIPRNNKNTP
jgi:hypothetical protein